MALFVSVVRCHGEVSAGHSSRGVLPTVVRRCERSRNLMNEEAMPALGRSVKKYI